MAIAHAANHGQTTAAGSSSTIAVTTTSAVASSRRIILSIGWFGSPTLSSVSGGGLTWVVDQQFGIGDRHVAFASADAPSGLASSTTITATLSGSASDRGMHVSTWSGMKTGSRGYLGTGVGNNNGTALGWSTGSISIAAGSMLIAAVHEDNSGNHDSTPTSPSVELAELNLSSFDDMNVAYRIEASAGSYSVAGTWTSGASQWALVYAEYLEASSSGPQTVNPGGLASASAFGSVTILPGGTVVSISGKGSSSAFGTVTIVPGGITASVSGLGSASSFGTVTIVPGGTSVSVSGLGSASSFGSITIIPGGTSVSVSGLGSEAAFGAPNVSAGGSFVSPGGLASAAAFGSVTIIPGGTIITVSGLGSASSFGAIGIATGGTIVVVGGLGSASVIGNPNVFNDFVPEGSTWGRIISRMNFTNRRHLNI